MTDNYDPQSFKDRIKASVEKSSQKDLNEINRLQGKGKKNKKPEKEVEKACLEWMRSLSWDVNIYEAKAVYNPDGTYRSSRMKAGVCDCMGVTPEGIPIYVEFKAKDRRTTFNLDKNIEQRKFLLKKIDYCAFAVVVDSAERLAEYWNGWRDVVMDGGLINGRDYLRSVLPKKKKSHDS